MNILNWVAANATAILSALLGLQAAAVVIVKLTPTPKDDAVLAKILPVVEKLAGFLSVKAKLPAADAPSKE